MHAALAHRRKGVWADIDVITLSTCMFVAIAAVVFIGIAGWFYAIKTFRILVHSPSVCRLLSIDQI
jgi:hypothetical protein